MLASELGCQCKSVRAFREISAQAVERSGGPDNVTIDQLIGIKEMLENEFTLAAALDDEVSD